MRCSVVLCLFFADDTIFLFFFFYFFFNIKLGRYGREEHRHWCHPLGKKPTKHMAQTSTAWPFLALKITTSPTKGFFLVMDGCWKKNKLIRFVTSRVVSCRGGLTWCVLLARPMTCTRLSQRASWRSLCPATPSLSRITDLSWSRTRIDSSLIAKQLLL